MTSLLTYLFVGAIVSLLISGISGHSLQKTIRFSSMIGLMNIIIWSLFMYK